MSAPVRNASASTEIPSPFQFDSVEDAVTAIGNGEFVVVMDDESRENEGDVVCAAGRITTEGMAWMVKWTSDRGNVLTPDSGFICISLPPRRLQELQLPPLLPRSGTSQDPKGTAYHLTIDADGSRHPTTTGISGHDRAYAARLLADGSASADEFTRPGHIVTLRYTPGGVVKRRGHTEAAVDLCYLAGQSPAGVLCELTNAEDPAGSMARRDDCYRFARTWGLKIISVDALASYAAREGSGRIPKAQDLEV